MKLNTVLMLTGLLAVVAGLFLFQSNAYFFESSIKGVPAEPIAALAESAQPLDIEAQRPLANPPANIKAVYSTSWSAGSEKKLAYFINLIKETELNAIIIDVKDFSGYVSYNTELELPKKYDAVELRVPRLNALVKRLHDEGIYVIGRISVFQDQRLALARPDLALYSSTTGQLWKDHKGLMWMDTAAREVWDYNIDIAKEILERGFDEANFDYVRFASDGNLNDIKHPFWDETTLKTHVVREFFRYLRNRLFDYKISADLFGLVTINTDGLGIGQHLEFALPYFDVIAPMVYPSHYYKGFIGYDNPGAHPYEVIKYSLETAVRRMNAFYKAASTTPVAKLRPWLQDFDLGADYDANLVRAEMQAVYDVASTAPGYFEGWMLWNPANVYTREALSNE